MKGYHALVLHAHLPFVRHPEYESFLEEDWLYEAISETYIPLLERFDRLVDEGGDRRPLLEWFKQRLAARAYLRTVIDDLSGALGEREETDVSHRRH